ncbi:TetR/AcrR family transcriptional regulator [Nocardioides sp.]|uniref:TetR/AcrR family transcriptional regulator n=1 Tax=Nocardioides sp. TaxID=35761 RepID=UPI003784589F
MTAADQTAPTRLDRRKLRTRRALVDAAVRLMASGRGERATVQEITEEADIGFGSFYNHFESKEQLFETAGQEVLERWGQLNDAATAGLEDPAEVFATSLRISGRLGSTHPDLARFLSQAGLAVLRSPDGLAPRALRDIQVGQEAGRFLPIPPQVALAAVAGGLIELLRVSIEDPGSLGPDAVDDLARGALRLLGLDADEAAAVVARPLPAYDGDSRLSAGG